MKRVVMVLVVLTSLLIPVFAGAATHPTYALGRSKNCRVGYTKHTERHVVKIRAHGHEKRESRRYVACVWIPTVPAQPASVPTTTAITTVATTNPSSVATTTTTAPVVTATTTAPPPPALLVGLGVVTDTTQIDSWAYSAITVPVVIVNLPTLTTGKVALTNDGLTDPECGVLVYSIPLREATTSCTFETENDPVVLTAIVPSVSFSGDENFGALSSNGPSVPIPIAPVPFVNDITSTVQCAESGGFCSEYNSAPETTSADANVFAGPIYEDVSPQIGTVTFTSADHLLICTASVYSAAGLPSNNARCTGDGGPFEGPLTAAYSGGSVEIGDTEIDVYSPATTVGGSN